MMVRNDLMTQQACIPMTLVFLEGRKRIEIDKQQKKGNDVDKESGKEVSPSQLYERHLPEESKAIIIERTDIPKGK